MNMIIRRARGEICCRNWAPPLQDGDIANFGHIHSLGSDSRVVMKKARQYRELKSRGPRTDAVFQLLDAMRLFREMSLPEIQKIPELPIN
jgi:hypothetical protein